MAGPRLVLASASPRRRALLEQAGIAFRVEPADVDERSGERDPERRARALAERKARAVAEGHAGERVFVLGADTIVALGPLEPGGEVLFLEKPTGAEDARRMLARLSGSRHRVLTGVSVVRCADLRVASGVECTFVSMRAIRPEEIEAYVASGEWRDKAGGYAIQESADAFVTALEGGGFDNVVGLPVELCRRLLCEAGWVP
jgi:septum formation protein